MKQNTARDFLLLAAVAFREGRHDAAGTFFAQAMTSDDAPELLAHLDAHNELGEQSLASDWDMSEQERDAPRASLQAIAASVMDGMAAIAYGDDEDETVEMPDVESDIEEDTDEEDTDSYGEYNPGMPGQRFIESSLSSDAGKGGARTVIVKLTGGAKSPVRVK